MEQRVSFFFLQFIKYFLHRYKRNSENNYNSNTGRVNVYENSGGTWSALGSQIDGASSGDQFGQLVLNAFIFLIYFFISISGHLNAKLYKLSGNTWVPMNG